MQTPAEIATRNAIRAENRAARLQAEANAARRWAEAARSAANTMRAEQEARGE